ncbi:unnamed protein product [Parajaminaea phylloscopi]
MFSALLHAPCELQLHLLQSVVFLFPPASRNQETDPDGPPSQTDSVVRGLVELWVPSARHISGIKVKLRAIQTVAILDANSGLIPVSWEDEVLMEKEVRIGMTPKSASHSKKERGRTPGPSGMRLGGGSRAGSRAPSPTGDHHHGSSRNSPAASRDVTARNSLEVRDLDHEHEHEREGIANMAAHLHSAFARAVSRGRPSSRPSSRPASRTPSRSRGPSRGPSPTPVERRPTLSTFAATSNSQAQRNASLAPNLLPASPQLSPRDEDRGRPSALRTDSSSSSLSTGLASLSVGAGVERQREAHNVEGYGHPDDEDFGISRGSRNGNTGRDSPLAHAHGSGFGSSASAASSSDLRGLGGLARSADPGRKTTGSVPPSVGKQKQRDHSAGINWSRWGRSVSRARGGGNHAKEGSHSRPPSLHKVPSSEHHEDDEIHHHHHHHHHPAAKLEHGIELEKGVHGFEFAFIIPADSPEYTRSPFGRVRYVIKATAYGAGRARSNLESWRDCFPVANPSNEGGPTPLTVLYNDLHPTVGLLSVACTSQNISVGGLFQLDIHSPVPPADLIIYLVRVSLETTIEIRTKRKGKQTVPAQRNKLFEKGYVPPRKEDPHVAGDGKKSDGFIRDPARDGAQSAWTVQGLARIPDDNSIRSSTMAGTRAAIRFSHQIVVEVVHSREADSAGGDRRLKVFTLRQPITLPSCCVAFDAATLPAYTPASEEGPTPEPTGLNGLPYDLAHLPNGARNGHLQQASGSGHGEQDTGATSPANGSTPTSGAPPPRPSTLAAHRGASHAFCVCGLSLQDLEARERAMMMPPQSATYDIPIDALRPHGKIGELPIARRRSRSRSVSTRRGSSSSQRSASLAGNIARRRSPSTSSTAPSIAGVGAALARSLSRGGAAGSSCEREHSVTRRDGRSGSLARVGRRGSSSTVGSTHTMVNYNSGAPVSRVTSTASARSGHSLARIDDDVRERNEASTSSAVRSSAPQIAEGEAPPSYDSAVFEEDEDEDEDVIADTLLRGRRR